VVTPQWVWDWPHQQLLYSYLDRYSKGEIKRLIINMPPRHGKTETITVRFPAWLLENDPAQRVILGAYSQTFVNKFSRKTRRIVDQRIGLSKERAAANEWETLQDGGMKAVGVGAGITGHGGDHIIVDDPVKNREEANSKVYREKVWDWFKDDLYTRLEPGGQIIVTMTRWHEDDLVGRIMKAVKSGEFEDEEQWHILNLPAIAIKDDPLGRPEGEPLCPDRFDKKDLLAKKAVMGISFYSLYQGSPTAQDGSIFKTEWWRTYTDLPPSQDRKRVIASWDTAFKTGADNDYSVGIVAIETDTGLYIVDMIRGKYEFPQLKQQLVDTSDHHGVTTLLIEDKASGQSVIQTLKQETMLPIIPIKVDKDKESRAHSASDMVQAGRVYLPTSASWVADFIDELGKFPYGEHDDIVDAMTQLINFIRKPEPMGMW